MYDPILTRREALTVLAVGATTGTGLISAAHSRLFFAKLTPQEGVETRAKGLAVFQLREDELLFVLTVSKLEDPFMAHIHENEPLGPIAVWLHDVETQNEQPLKGEINGILDAGTITDETIEQGRAEEAESMTVAQLVELIDAGEAYINVHTEANPGGELAGRIRSFR